MDSSTTSIGDRRREEGQRPVLSICIPTYNRAQFLGVALDSILAQANPALVELVILDNHSTDNTEALVAGYSGRAMPIRYVRRELNVGSDRNVLEIADYAAGEYFWIFGSDDSLPLGAMQTVLAAIDKGRPDLILGDAIDCDISLTPTGYLKFLRREETLFDFSQAADVMAFLDATTMTASLFGYLTSMVIKLDTWRRVSIARFTIGSAYPQVYRALDIVFAAGTRCLYLAKPIANNRRNNCGYIEEFGEFSRYMIDFRMFRIAIDRYFSQSAEIRNRFRRFVRSCFGRFAHESLRTGIAAMDDLLEFFEITDDAVPHVEPWQRLPLVQRAFLRFQHNGIYRDNFMQGLILHVGYRQDGGAKLMPINESAIGIEQGYSGYNGIALLFESASAATIYVSDYFGRSETDEASDAAIRDWFRVLQVGGRLVISNMLNDAGPLRREVRLSWLLAKFEDILGKETWRLLHCSQSGSDDAGLGEFDLMLEKLPLRIAALDGGSEELVPDAAALHAQGFQAYQGGDHATAVHLVTRSLLIDGEPAEAYCNLCCAYAALGGEEEALRCFAMALRRNSAVTGAARNIEVLQAGSALRSVRREAYESALRSSEQLRQMQACSIPWKDGW